MANKYVCPVCGFRPTSAPNVPCPNCRAAGDSSSSQSFFPTNNPDQFQPDNASNPFQPFQPDNTSNPFQQNNASNPFQQNNAPDQFQPLQPDNAPNQFEPFRQNNAPQSFSSFQQGNEFQPNPVPASDTLKTGRNTYTGMVQSVEIRQAQRNKPSVLRRLGQTVFRGVPFSMAPSYCVAQISVNSAIAHGMGGVNTSKSILFFCHEDEFGPSLKPGNIIEVHGSTGSDGAIYPHSIYNRSTGTSIVTPGIPAWIIRTAAIVLVLLAVLAAESSIPGMGSLFDPAFFQRLGDKFVELIALIIVGAILISVIRNNPKIRSLCIWIIVLLLAAMLVPQLVGIIILIFALKCLISGRLL